MKFPLLIRAASIAAVAAALVYPLTLVNQKVFERQVRAEQVASHFAAETSGPQAIVGPLLAELVGDERHHGREPEPLEFSAGSAGLPPAGVRHAGQSFAPPPWAIRGPK